MANCFFLFLGCCFLEADAHREGMISDVTNICRIPWESVEYRTVGRCNIVKGTSIVPFRILPGFQSNQWLVKNVRRTNQTMSVSFTIGADTVVLDNEATIRTGEMFQRIEITSEDEENSEVAVTVPRMVGKTLNLSSVLDGIIVDGDPFLPDTIYIREAMNKFLAVFCDPTYDERRIVIGAPGVGKSILTFLAYLWEASNHRDRSMFYFRKTGQKNEGMSIFFIQPGEVPGEAKVKYRRNVPHALTVNSIFLAIAREHPSGTLIAVDGPKHDQVDDVSPQFDLITSGGHPVLKDEQIDNMRFVILDSWSEADSVSCLKNLKSLPKKQAKMNHDIAGGSVRDLMMNTRARRRLVRSRKELIQGLSDTTVELVVRKSTREPRGYNFDSLRAMYAADSVLEEAYQPIQSPLYLRLLRSSVSLGSARRGVEKARMIGIGNLYGIYFELFAHKAMSTLSAMQKLADWDGRTLPFDTVVGTGGWKNSVLTLNRANLYWQPEEDNFPNIDSAMLVGEVLHCLQYLTAQDGFHVFNLVTFKKFFLDELPVQGYTSIKVHFVTPQDRQFRGVKLPKSQESFGNTLSNPQNLLLQWLKSKHTAKKVSSSSLPSDEITVAANLHAAGTTNPEAMDISDPDDSDYFPSDGEDEDAESRSASSDAYKVVGGIAVEFAAATLSTQLNLATECPFDFLQRSM